jgi:RNA polymerase sigma-70 factor (ECF subfamily)
VVDDPAAREPTHKEPRPTLRQVFDEYARFVWRTVRHLGVREADIEDVCQEVFLTVHRKLRDFEGRSSLRTWLYGICLRTASDYRRRAHVRREFAVEDPAPRAQAPEQHDEVQRQQARRRLAAILDQLDDDKRTVFVLYEIEEISMKEVAKIVDCPLQTAYSRLHAARDRVIQLIDQVVSNDEACT